MKSGRASTIGGLIGLVIALSLVAVTSQVLSNTDDLDNLCGYAHQQQVDERHVALINYRRIPPAQRDTLVLAGITLRPMKELRENYRGRYGNRRIPSYCPQHDWPEKLPKELR